jgi:ubiquinone/menaquinone biosynthesis C-methylase UbiE
MTLLNELLICPTCKAGLVVVEERCARCGVKIGIFRGGYDFLPEGALSALAGSSRPSWSDWSDRLAALERWRAARKEQPTLQQRDRDRLQRVVSFAAPAPGLLLDLGCGSASLKAFLPEGVSYIGVDPMPNEALISQGFVIRGVAEYLPFADGRFASVAMLSVFDYFVDPERALSEARRVLSPMGLLMMVITVRDASVAEAFHAVGPLAPLMSLRVPVIRAVGLKGALRLAQMQISPKHKAHVSYFSEASILSLVRKFFLVEETCYDEPGVLFLRLRRSKEA